MSSTDSYSEAERIMTICNACRYCEGHCAVFPAMTLRLEFGKGDLDYLANLCHGCQACFHHCQYTEPHEFAVNVPKTFSEVRRESYAASAWPSFMELAFKRNGLWTGLVLFLSLVAFLLGVISLTGTNDFFTAHENKFYGVMPHSVMAGTFMVVSLFVLLSIVISIGRFWRLLGLPSLFGFEGRAVLNAIHDALTVKHLDGGAGEGCTFPNEAPSLARRRFHHFTFYGFLFCFAATSVGTFYHYGLNLPAPYDLFTLPKILGTIGGIGLIIGPVGLLWLKFKSEPLTKDAGALPMDLAFLLMLLLTSASGLLLMLVGNTSYVGLALVIHLGAVLGLFLTMPYGKFIHGIYRFITLIAHAKEQKTDKAVLGSQMAE